MTSPSTAPQLWVLNVVALVGTMAIMAFVAVVGPVVRLLGLADWHGGLALTVGGVLWMLAARRWGKLSDKVGRRRVLLISLSAYAVTYVLMAWSIDLALTSPPAMALSLLILVGSRALVGLFYAAVPAITAASVADQVVPQHRASAMAKLGAANAVGLVAGPVVAGWIALYDIAWSLYAAAAMPVLALVLIAWKLPETYAGNSSGNQAGSKPGQGSGPVVGWLDARLRLPLFAVFAAMMAVAITQATVGFLVLDRMQLSLSEGAKTAGYALTAVGAGLICSQSLMMRITRPPERWLLLGSLLAGSGFGAVAWLESAMPMLAAFGLAGLGMGMVRPAVQALTANRVDAHEQGAAAGMVASMQGLSMIVGPLAGTLLYRIAPGAPYVLVLMLLMLLAIAVWRYSSADTIQETPGVSP
ncbi:MFS transporter [Oceanimonas smirnovii]|uniref:MFS transporter n=1 Tax=Oceanimonas smirnovii TaxID=264574 RepID=UPI003FD50A02